MKAKNLLSIILSGSLLFSLVGCQGKESKTENKVVKVGVVGESSDQWEPVIKNLAKEGITVELVPFSDYSQPNQALADKEIDLNSFQHYAYLKKDVADRGFDLSVIGETLIAPLGVYSSKIKSVNELKDGDSIAIPSDATNGGRALKVLEAAGVIKVKESAGYTPTLDDIVENTKNIKFVEVEAAQTPRLLEDVAAALINGGHAVDAGFNPKEDSIYLEEVKKGSDNPYINVIVARSEDKDNEVYKKVVEEFRTDEVAKVIEEVYKGAYIPTWK
jgi:D-methionine transport system substrate-binding protein